MAQQLHKVSTYGGGGTKTTNTGTSNTGATPASAPTSNTTTSTSNTKTSTSSALKRGSKGDNVKDLQTTLNSLGYNLDVDGSFGPATEAAVKDYQSKNGLEVDGSVGPKTTASLSANTATTTPATTPAVTTPAVTTPAVTTPEATAPTEETPVTQQPVVIVAQPSTSGAELANQWASSIPQVNTAAQVSQWKESIPDVGKAKSEQKALLEQWKASLLEQSNNQIDYGVAKAIAELERALEDAQPQFKEQQESIDKDAAAAKDNAALYAELRGDKGGIGAEQYNSIQNTAAQNRLSVQQAQTKLVTDTQRQIADLRAQGEFDKADAALEISQQYLSQLMNLEQWAFDAGMSAAQFKVTLDQWAADYNMAMAQFKTGLDQWAAQFDYNAAQDSIANNQWQQQFNYNASQDSISNDLAYGQLTGIIPSTGQTTLSYQNQLASNGWDMLSNGVMPSSSQLTAMGMTSAKAQEIITAAKLAAQNEQNLAWAKLNQSSSGSNVELSDADYVSGYQKAYNAGCRSYEDAFEFFVSKEGGDHPTEEAAELATYFAEKWGGDKTGFLNLPDYNTILKNSEAGLYGPEFGAVLKIVQSMWSTQKNNEAIAEYLEKKLNAGKINEYGVAVIMQTLGM